jgi:hypothetical protein
VSIRIHQHHHQWRYSPDRALASLTGFMIFIVRCGLSAPRSTWFYTWFSHQRHLVVITRDSSAEAGKHGWEMAAEFCRRVPIVLVGFFTGRKSTTWDRRLYFPSEGRCAADFITLKIHRPRPGLNPRTLCPVASTLTTRPPRATNKDSQYQITTQISSLITMLSRSTDRRSLWHRHILLSHSIEATVTFLLFMLK